MNGPRNPDGSTHRAPGPTGAGSVRVQLIGPLAVLVDGEAADIPAGRATQLLALLALHQGRFVSADVIVEALWADPQPSAYQGVASLVSRLRRAIGRHTIEGDRHGYRLAAEAETDLGEIEDLVGVAGDHLRAGHPARAATPATRALALLERGHLLEAYPDAPWADDARRVLERQHRQAWEVGWSAGSQIGDHALAAELAEAALAADELDEAATVAAMTAWSALGRVGRADAAGQGPGRTVGAGPRR
ncbi:MAG: AfsR/SARP family transcriptional regulator [Acidimicrobiales bacterium]